MKGRKKPNKWVTVMAAAAAAAAVYLAFDIGRGTYYNNLGTTHMAEGEYDKAIDWFQKAVQHNPRDQHARNLLVKLQTEQERD